MSLSDKIIPVDELQRWDYIILASNVRDAIIEFRKNACEKLNNTSDCDCMTCHLIRKHLGVWK